MVVCAHADVFVLIANQLMVFRVCNTLLWNEEKETSLLKFVSSRNLSWRVRYTLCSMHPVVQRGVKQETDLLELT